MKYVSCQLQSQSITNLKYKVNYTKYKVNYMKYKVNYIKYNNYVGIKFVYLVMELAVDCVIILIH